MHEKSTQEIPDRIQFELMLTRLYRDKSYVHSIRTERHNDMTSVIIRTECKDHRDPKDVVLVEHVFDFFGNLVEIRTGSAYS